MKEWLTALVARIKGIHATDHVIAEFHTVLDKLRQVAAHHDVIAEAKAKIAEEASKAKALAIKEADKARSVAKRFEDFLHGK
jgi:negative regulator of sigma E activity